MDIKNNSNSQPSEEERYTTPPKQIIKKSVCPPAPKKNLIREKKFRKDCNKTEKNNQGRTNSQ